MTAPYILAAGGPSGPPPTVDPQRLSAAIAAMQSMIIRDHGRTSPEHIAAHAVMQADALIQELKRMTAFEKNAAK